MFTGKKISAIVFCLHFVICSQVFANKSVFIISNHVNSYAQAYALNGSQVTLQGNFNIPHIGDGAVGLDDLREFTENWLR